jgi:hypothetical protein
VGKRLDAEEAKRGPLVRSAPPAVVVRVDPASGSTSLWFGDEHVVESVEVARVSETPDALAEMRAEATEGG